jgi:trans-2,3-dihydro-3-hydroxyanthranilate isomerase
MTILVDACVRHGRGGSPTAVVFDDGTASDADRRSVPVLAGTSHAAFLARERRADGSRAVRFFTSTGELRGCGHGTVAAQAVLLDAVGGPVVGPAVGGPGPADRGADHVGRQYTGGRTFDVRATRRPDGIEVWFDQGIVTLRPPSNDELAAIGALGVRPRGEVTVASPGAPRLLVPVADRETLAALAPDLPALAAATRRLGLLGCFVYVPPDRDAPAAARMFAPAIGVPEDVANANSTGCLAAHLLVSSGTDRVEVEQGDALGRPATVFASAEPSYGGIRTWIGGLAVIRE